VSQRIAIVSATKKEIEPVTHFLKEEAFQYSPTQFLLQDLQVDLLVTGIGILSATYSLMNYLMEHSPTAWLQAGIGGAFDRTLEKNKTYLIESEVLVDFGAQDHDGKIHTPFDLGWMEADQFPYSQKIMKCPYLSDELLLPKASGMTTLYAHGFADKIATLHNGLHGQIENMEGAAFFYVSLLKNIPFWSLRSISNYVEKRDTSAWTFDEAIGGLNDHLIALLTHHKIPIIPQ